MTLFLNDLLRNNRCRQQNDCNGQHNCSTCVNLWYSQRYSWSNVEQNGRCNLPYHTNIGVIPRHKLITNLSFPMMRLQVFMVFTSSKPKYSLEQDDILHKQSMSIYTRHLVAATYTHAVRHITLNFCYRMRTAQSLQWSSTPFFVLWALNPTIFGGTRTLSGTLEIRNYN